MRPGRAGQSIGVEKFEGYNVEGAVTTSPLHGMDRNASSTSSSSASPSASAGGGGEIYSCTGSVVVDWNHTGLLEEVNVRVRVEFLHVVGYTCILVGLTGR